MKPAEGIAGYPGNNGVNPTFRETIMHADIFGFVSIQGKSAQVWKDRYVID
jgi:hypothetical protein